MRKREARGEESREPEKKGSEDGDDEWVPVVPNMEAGGSRLQTTDPKDVVEKIVMDELEERKSGRGSDGLVRGGVYSCQGRETNGKGKGKGEGGKGEHEGTGRFGCNGQHGSKGAPKSTRKVQDKGKKKKRQKFQRDLRQLEEKRRGRSRGNVA